MVEQINNKNDLKTYLSKADTAFVRTIYVDSTLNTTKVKIYSKREFKPLNIELNSADTTQLKKVYGIGSVFANRIVEYRKRLGGYVSVGQLREVRGVDDQKFEQIVRNFYVDTCGIVKINVNFAPAIEFAKHPYGSESIGKRIVKFRKSKDKKAKGGIFNLQQLLENDIILPNEANKLASYLTF